MSQKQSTGKLTGVVTSCRKGGADNRYRVGVLPMGMKTVVYCDSWYSLRIGTTVVIAGRREDD